MLVVLQEHLERVHPRVDPRGFCGTLAREYGEPSTDARPVKRALLEAWEWLRAKGLVSIDPDASSSEWYLLTRRAETILQDTHALETFHEASQFPDDLLHPRIAEVARADFLRGDYESTIFKSFKEVEVAVRSAGGFGAGDIGVALMRSAFHPERGPLRDSEEEAGERQALMELFAGAIGRFKNPSSHRHAVVEDPAEAVEAIMLASHLLRIVDRRSES